MEIKRGMVFRCSKGGKYHIANTFTDETTQLNCVTWKFWNDKRKRWFFNADFTELFLLRFEYGWKFELKKHQKEFQEYIKKQR